jgi:nucleoid-associated protein YgaU
MSIVENIMGQTEKLVFKAYSDVKFEKPFKIKNTKDGLDSDSIFSVQYNPSEFNVSFSTDYEEIDDPNHVPSLDKEGKSVSIPKIKKLKLPEITLEFILDGTGASTNFLNGFKKMDVANKISDFKEFCFVPNPETHTMNFIKIVYGKLIYKTVFKSVDVKYTLFRNDGYPLRAKVNAKFITVIETNLLESKLSFNSPDVTHKRTLKDFDTLVAMSNTIYDNNYLYQEVARFNNLNSFRKILTGSEIYFPPLQK